MNVGGYGRQRQREEKDDVEHRPAVPRPRYETPCRRAFSDEIRHFLENAHGSFPQDDLRQCCRQVLFEILASCWKFSGSAADCFESVRQLPAFVIHLLSTFGGYELTESGQYLQLRTSRSGVIPMPCVGALACALADSLGCESVLPEHREIRISLAGCRSFLWDISENLVPQLSQHLADADIAVAWDTMITHAGSPTVARVNGFSEFSAHFRFGLGITTFVRKASSWTPVSCGTFVNNDLVAQAIMLSMSGPLLIHAHVLREVHDATSVSEVERWCTELLASPTRIIVVLSGPHADDFTSFVSRRTNKLSAREEGHFACSALLFGRGAGLVSCEVTTLPHSVAIDRVILELT